MRVNRSNCNIVLAGDICLLKHVDVSSFVADIRTYGAGLCIANIETPIGENNASPRPKSGPHLSGHGSLLFELAGELDWSFCLANNHMMDYGDQGLLATMNACRESSSSFTGAGTNLHDAQTPAVISVDGVEIGVIACCETQFGIASPESAGVSPVSAAIYQQIRDLKRSVDVVAISIHGGAEMCPWPSPHWQDLLRSFIDAGATIVHGHHSHVPQGYEEYNNGVIFYGLGNFVVDPRKWSETSNAMWSLVGHVTVCSGGVENINVLTAEVESGEKGRVTVHASTASEAAAHKEYIANANRPLADSAILAGLWQESSVRMYQLWNRDWLGFETAQLGVKGEFRNLMESIKNYVAGASRPGRSAVARDKHLLWYHLFSCESHRDSIATALGVLSGELSDMRTDWSRAQVDEMMPWSCAKL